MSEYPSDLSSDPGNRDFHCPAEKDKDLYKRSTTCQQQTMARHGLLLASGWPFIFIFLFGKIHTAELKFYSALSSLEAGKSQALFVFIDIGGFGLPDTALRWWSATVKTSVNSFPDHL